MKKTTQRDGGQAIVEYMLLSTVSMLIFGFLFLAARKQVYQLWICDLMPRIRGPTGCDPNSDCIQQVYQSRQYYGGGGKLIQLKSDGIQALLDGSICKKKGG